MKSLFVSAFLLLGAVSGSRAQVSTTKPVPDTDNAAPDFAATSAAKATLPDFLAADPFAEPRANAAPAFSARDLRATPLAEPAAAEPAAPSPNPKFVYGSRDDYRWQLGLAFAWVNFRSSYFDANEFGIKTTVSYFLNDWLGVEGSFTGAFGGSAAGGVPKIGLYGGGPKFAWRQKRWEPWLHAIFGGAHEGPQALVTGRNSTSLQLGGGGDYRLNPHLSIRIEGDYVHTAFFHQTQNNFQLASGAVIHF